MLRRREVVPVAYFPRKKTPGRVPRRPLRALERREEPTLVVAALPANHDVEMQEHPANPQIQSSVLSAQRSDKYGHSIEEVIQPPDNETANEHS